jgi:hypothetical protein
MGKNLCRDNTEALDALDKATTGRQGERTDPVNNVNEVSEERPVGNSNTYALRKLRRDRPDLHRSVLDEEITPHAAMVEAGFRPRSATFYPEDLARGCNVLKGYIRQNTRAGKA